MKDMWIIGIDEVGRGPLAGPITVAAVALKKSSLSIYKRSHLNNIRDSKKLTASQREMWNAVIRDMFTYAVASVSHDLIDKKGIQYAAYTAVNRCIKKIADVHAIKNKDVEIMLDGGLRAQAQYKHQTTIIKGDEREPLIAAASIIAKVHRDAYMRRLAKKLPQYGFEHHKGYGTAAHREAIMIHGLSSYHRKTFCRHVLL